MLSNIEVIRVSCKSELDLKKLYLFSSNFLVYFELPLLNDIYEHPFPQRAIVSMRCFDSW